MRDYFNKLAHDRVWMRRRFAYYHRDLAEYCGYFIHPDSSVLELGCGTGELLAQVPGARKVGVDFSPAMIDEARRQFPALEWRVQPAEEVSPDGGPYDVILLSNLVPYLDDVQKVLERIRGVCHPKTKIIITYINHLWEPLLALCEGIGLKPKSPPLNWLSVEDVDNLLYMAGFEPFRHVRRLLCPLFIPLISRLINRYVSHVPGFRRLGLTQITMASPQPVRTAASSPQTVSVVVPARNEAGNIRAALERTPVMGAGTELIFVEGHSTDDTWAAIRKEADAYRGPLKVSCVRQDGKGKGDAVRKGFDLATGDILMILDADLTMPPEMLPRYYDALVTGHADFVMGSRLVYPMADQAMRFLNMLGNKSFSAVFSWLLDQPVKDTLCGTKAMFRQDYRRLVANRSFFGDFDPFGDFDLIFGAFKLNLRIAEIPIRYQARTYGETNISRFRHGWLLLQMCGFAARKLKFF